MSIGIAVHRAHRKSVANVRFWHKADIANVRSMVAIGG